MKYEPLLSGYYYHIFNQGNNKEDIFFEEKNYLFFLMRLEKYITPVATILSYCLLKNHFHLLVYTKENLPEKKISMAFSNLFNSYSKSINKRYNRSGSLFRDRFKRKKVNTEAYLKNLIVYININPVLHGLINNIDTYPYTSYHSLIDNSNTYLDKEEIINLFDNKKNFIYYIENQILTQDEKFKNITLE